MSTYGFLNNVDMIGWFILGFQLSLTSLVFHTLRCRKKAEFRGRTTLQFDVGAIA
jgi:hypothetical protein